MLLCGVVEPTVIWLYNAYPGQVAQKLTSMVPVILEFCKISEPSPTAILPHQKGNFHDLKLAQVMPQPPTPHQSLEGKLSRDKGEGHLFSVTSVQLTKAHRTKVEGPPSLSAFVPSVRVEGGGWQQSQVRSDHLVCSKAQINRMADPHMLEAGQTPSQSVDRPNPKLSGSTKP